MRLKAEVYIGTSGWSYKGWHEKFYPPKTTAAGLLAFYAGVFRTVEINASFYRLPSVKMIEGWRDKVPPGFLYAVKGSRFITHMKKLKDPVQPLQVFFDRIAPLQERIGAILWQLPPQLRMDLPRLGDFLAALPAGYRYAVEFRHPSWFEGETFDLLRRHGAANVWISSLQMPMDFTVTAGFIYLRFHGLAGGFGHDYTRAELKPWAAQIREQARQGRPAFVYFNNDWNARAPQNAQELMRMVGVS